MYNKPIILCKDCEYWTKVAEDYYVCNQQECSEGCTDSCWHTEAEDFCSRGKKKEQTTFQTCPR